MFAYGPTQQSPTLRPCANDMPSPIAPSMVQGTYMDGQQLPGSTKHKIVLAELLSFVIPNIVLAASTKSLSKSRNFSRNSFLRASTTGLSGPFFVIQPVRYVQKAFKTFHPGVKAGNTQFYILRNSLPSFYGLQVLGYGAFKCFHWMRLESSGPVCVEKAQLPKYIRQLTITLLRREGWTKVTTLPMANAGKNHDFGHFRR
ncbi:hypothetical protein TNCV_610571 [Trichonephila clavipes]|nr:hypothetical protein TNCV_610571 [Trichonephila clavipes]